MSQQIHDLTKKWEKWYNEENAEALAGLYCADAMIITGNKKALVGKEILKAYYSSQFEQIDGKIELIVESIDICGKIAIERGKWNFQYSLSLQSGSYLTQWEWINGSWFTQFD